MVKTTVKAKSMWDSLNERTQKIVSIITAVGVIGGTFFGGVNYIVARLDDHIQEQTTTLSSQLQEVRLSTTRNELLSLMNGDPENVLEIERVAKRYFTEYNGDWYMSGLYSKYAAKYGADTSFVTK